MRGRAVDLALILGLIVIGGAIVWTLFSLGGSSGPAPTPGDTPSVDGPETPGDPGVVPVAPGDEDADGGGPAADGDPAGARDGASGAGANAGGANGDGAVPLPPGGDATGGDATDADDGGDAAGAGDDPPDDAPDQDADGGGPPSDGPDPEVPAAEAPPVPEQGPVQLGRVGFSFVTGGAGACGIVLEPWTHVAVSRELLEAYGCGAEVTLTLSDPKDGRSRVEAVVADTMNPSFSRTVNVYVGEDEPALAYGLTSGTIAPR
jgi:hypothetical protein